MPAGVGATSGLPAGADARSGLPPAAPAAAPAASTWPSPGGWQGGGIGEITHPASAPPPSTLTAPSLVTRAAEPAQRVWGVRSSRARRAADAQDGSAGPPWEPAPQPQSAIGPLRAAAAASGPPPEASARIRVPGDMADPPAETTDPSLPRFDLSRPPEGFDLSTPAFGLTPTGFGQPTPDFRGSAPGFEGPGEPPADFRATLPAFDAPAPEAGQPQPGTGLPTQRSLDFAAAPVATDYMYLPPADEAARARSAADPGSIWDLSATDVFPPARPGSGPPPMTTDTRPDPLLPPDEDPGTGGS